VTGSESEPRQVFLSEEDGWAYGPWGRGFLRCGTVVYSGCTIGERLETGHNVVIREDCELGDDVSIWSNTVIDYGTVIGNGVKIHCNCYVAQYTEIGDGAFLAPGVSIANDLYPGQDSSREMMSGPYIGAGAQLGVNVTVLPFVRIGEGAIIGAGSVVTRDVAPGTVAFGNPAQPRGRVEDLVPVEDRVDGSVRPAGHRFSLRKPDVPAPEEAVP
jgi:acetyltransferase-like isoleucine patch superfamily enzyme